MAQIEKILTQIKNNPKNVNFTDLMKVCNHYFGEPRQQGTSHCIYKTPWAGDPRVNIQEKNGKAKVYQVRQVLDEERKNGGYTRWLTTNTILIKLLGHKKIKNL